MRHFNRITLICLFFGLLATANGCDHSKVASTPAVDDLSSKVGQACMVLTKEDLSAAATGREPAVGAEFLKGGFVRRTAEFLVLQPPQGAKAQEIWIKNEHVAVIVFGSPEQAK